MWAAGKVTYVNLDVTLGLGMDGRDIGGHFGALAQRGVEL